jgi:hypothetical protein
MSLWHEARRKNRFKSELSTATEKYYLTSRKTPATWYYEVPPRRNSIWRSEQFRTTTRADGQSSNQAILVRDFDFQQDTPAVTRMRSLTAFCGALGVRARTSHFARFGAVLPFSPTYGLARRTQSPTAAGGRVDSTGAIDSDVFISHRAWLRRL